MEIFEKEYKDIEEIQLGFNLGNLIIRPNKGKFFDEGKNYAYIYSVSKESKNTIKIEPEVLISFYTINSMYNYFPRLIKDNSLISSCFDNIARINICYDCKAMLINKANTKLNAKIQCDSSNLCIGFSETSNNKKPQQKINDLSLKSKSNNIVSNSDSNSDNGKLYSEISNLKKQLKDKNTIIEKLNIKIQSLENKLNSIINKYKEKKSLIQDLQNNINKKDQELQQLQNQLGSSYIGINDNKFGFPIKFQAINSEFDLPMI